VHLHAAFVPPPETVVALVAAVRGQEPAATAAVSERRGLFGRRTPEPAAPAGPLLDVLDPERVLVPITDFGYVASGDARRLGDTLEQVCAGLPPGPTLRVRGGAALVDPDDRSVWAEIAGSEEDLAAMRAIAQAVVAGVEPLGYFCDRRQFKPRLAVATITETTTVEHLEQVLATLDTLDAPPWQVGEVTLMQRGAGTWRVLPVGR
jgi:hypothetical protein